MPTIEERVTNLEKVLEEFIRNVGIEFNKLYNAQMRTEMELKEEEMRKFREESEKDRIALHNEMRAFKDEMREFKDEMREENRKRNREWSNLAKKMGTIVEDLIAPALRPVISRYFECNVKMEGQRMFKRKDGEDYEIDAILECDDKIFMIEAKSTPRVSDVDDIEAKSKRFFEFFPEYKVKKLIIILGSITFPQDVIQYATQKDIYVMAWREWDYMDILNYDEIQKKNL